MPTRSSSARCRGVGALGTVRSVVGAATLLALFISSCSDEPEAGRESNPEPSPVETPLDSTDHPVVYMSDDEAEGPFDLWLMKEDGSDALRLTSEPGTEESPDWSPDGRRIAFVGTGTNDTYDLYIINADGTGLRQLTDTADKAEVTRPGPPTAPASCTPLSTQRRRPRHYRS